MINTGDPVPYNPPVPSIPFMIDAYYHVGFGLTLHNYPTADCSKQLKTGLPIFLFLIKLALSPDWFHKKDFSSIKYQNYFSTSDARPTVSRLLLNSE